MDITFTYCEWSLEIRQRLSSGVDNPSLRRYFSSLLTRSIMRSTSSLASLHQWWKLLNFTQDFTILAWFSMRSMARAIALVLVLLNKYEDLRVYGSCELPSSQYIYYWLFETIASPFRERWTCSKMCKISFLLLNKNPFLLLNSWVHSICMVV
jgi:hypothetical protein